MISGLAPGRRAPHGDGRKINLRKRRNRQEIERNRPGERDRNGQQRRGDRPANEWRRNVHSCSAGMRAPLAFSLATTMPKSHRQVVEENVDDGRGVKREHLAEEQSANHRNAQRPAQFRTDAAAESERQPAKQRGHRGHHNGPETQQAGLVNGVGRNSCPALRSASSAKSIIMMPFFFTMPISRMIPISATTLSSWPANQQSQNRSDSGRRQRGQNRDRDECSSRKERRARCKR